MPNSKNNKTKKPVAKSKKPDDTPVRIRKDMPNPHGEGKPDEQEEWNARQHGHRNDPMHEGCGCAEPVVPGDDMIH